MGSEDNTMPRCPYRPLLPRMLLPVPVAMVTAGKGSAHIGPLVCNSEALPTAKLEVGALSALKGPLQLLSLS